MIPLIDLSLDRQTGRTIKNILGNVLDSNSYILGSRLESFEKKFAKYIGARYAVGVANGTDAIRLALRALGVGSDDQVLTVSFTSPFTAIAIIEEGAIPVFCDVDEKTWTLDTQDALKKITKKTRAIVPVHIYGNPCDMNSISKLAKKNNLKVIEDTCQAHGAVLGKNMLGTFGDAAAFSFYPTKNLGGIGDGGAVVTNNKKLANKIKILRYGGQSKRFWHKYQGVNSRLDEIQAAVLSVKLANLDKYNLQRSKLVARYRNAFKKLPMKFQETRSGAKSANHLFVIQTSKRNDLKKFLESRNINCDIYYPFPIHMQPAFRQYVKGRIEVTERLSKEVLALPLFPRLSLDDQDKVIAAVKEFFKD